MFQALARALVLGSVVAGGTLLTAQGGVAGNWALTVESPQGTSQANLRLAPEGDALKGSISSDMGETPFTGTVKGEQVRFQFDYPGPSGPITITATATVSGDDIKGEFDYGGGVALFTGKRASK